MRHLLEPACGVSEEVVGDLGQRARQCEVLADPGEQGIDAAMAAACASAIAGFAATSNVEAARRYGPAPTGTMAHSHVEAFDTEIDALRAFAEDHPERPAFLVDT